jgi:diacylglycerol kinase
MTEAMVYLAVSHKAAKLVNTAIEQAVDEQFGEGEEADILLAIQKDIREQLPTPKKKKAKRHAR